MNNFTVHDIWKPTSISELTPNIFELTHLGLDASTYNKVFSDCSHMCKYLLIDNLIVFFILFIS